MQIDAYKYKGITLGTTNNAFYSILLPYFALVKLCKVLLLKVFVVFKRK